MEGLSEEYKTCNNNLSSYKEEMEQVINKTINRIMDQLIDYFNYERIPCNQRTLENLVFNLKDEIKYNTNYLKIISAQQDCFNSNNIEEISYDIEANTKKLLNSIDFEELLFNVKKEFNKMYNYNDDLTYELSNIIKTELRRLDEITHDITNDYTKKNINSIKNKFEEKQAENNNSTYSFVINMNPDEAVNYLKEEFKNMSDDDIIKVSEEILKQIPFRTDVLANFLFEKKHGKINDNSKQKETNSFDNYKDETYNKVFNDNESIMTQMMRLCSLSPDEAINYLESCFNTMTKDQIKKELEIINKNKPFDISLKLNNYINNKQKELLKEKKEELRAMFK